MIEEDFRGLDKNSDGNFTLDEFEKRLRTTDVNGDSRTSFVEFHKMLRPGIPLTISYASFIIYDQMDNHKDSITDIWDIKMTLSLMDINPMVHKNTEKPIFVNACIFQGANSTTLIFNAIDGNNDDIIRLSEMFVGYDEDDGNKDGMMTPEEFAAGKHPGSPPLSIKKAFEFYDKRDKEKNNILDGSCVNAFFKGLDTNSKYMKQCMLYIYMRRREQIDFDDTWCGLHLVVNTTRAVTHQFADLPAEYIMLVIVFLGLLAVALSSPDNYAARMFEYLDDNKDGVVGFSEWFANYLHDDLNGDQHLTLEEFAAGTHPGSPPLEVEKAFKIFDKMDGHEKGFISPSSAEALFKRLDSNSNMVPLTAVTTLNSFMFIIKFYRLLSLNNGNTHNCIVEDSYDNQNIRKLFNGIDENRDGFIQFPELLSRFDEIDTNSNDGNVTIDECLASKPSEMSLNEIESYFKFYDELDGAADGVVRRAVIQRIQFLIDANSECSVVSKKRLTPHLTPHLRINMIAVPHPAREETDQPAYFIMKFVIFLGLLGVVLGNDANYVFELFHATDSNNDNVILFHEMMETFNYMDLDDDYQLTLEEFGSDLIPGSPPLDAESAFKFFDTKDLEENGFLDKSAVLFYFNGLDSNKDGRLTLAEYMENYFLRRGGGLIGNFIMKVVILSCLLAAVLGVDYYAFKRGFESLDLDDDGVVRPEELLALIELNDLNNDGNITIEEDTATQVTGTPEIVIQGNFNYYDKLDGAADGVISMSVAPVLVDILDADGDGEITVEDWFMTLPQVIDGIENEIAALYAA
ncbi:hypothetical protein C0Q70_13012 [Pomacea canaliculata]|uniref:EF-hand domain-containing protein n=1 Tax=Pomacea canaliculata TaxID=400727 RepID=A0A2T7P333_POMCA|nr:hypothetical protein C0Q70_13012 [Pomacea canaliculata]